MSEIRVDEIQSYQDFFSVTLAGITTFSGTGCVSMPGGTSTQRPEVSKKGQIRYINGDVKKGLEYYNGTEWLTVRVSNGESYEGITPIGIFGGGDTGTAPTVTNSNVLDFIAISSGATNAVDFGDLVTPTSRLASCSSSTRGIFAGGLAPTFTNVINYITITNSGNATDFGDLTASNARSLLAGCSSSTRGIFGGGRTQTTPAVVNTNTIDYITIASQGTNAATFGTLSTAGRSGLSACSSSTRGVFGGGYTPTKSNVIDYITIATLSNAQSFGALTSARDGLAACSSSTIALFAGGNTPTVVNTVDDVTIATLSDASSFGTLSVARTGLSACSSSIRGIFAGGQGVAPTNTKSNVIDFTTIASTGTVSDFGDLTASNARAGLAACSNNHGGLLST